MSYSYIWYIDFAENYVFTKEGRCFNLLTSKQIKQCLHGYTIGYNIKGKFYSLKTLRTHLLKIKKTKKGVDVDTLTHEIYHLTTKIMKHNGFKFNKTDEPFSMLNGKLNSIIMGKLIKQGDKLYYPINKQIKIK